MKRHLYSELRTLYETTDADPHTFRVTIKLKDLVDGNLLRNAVERTMRRYPYFRVRQATMFTTDFKVVDMILGTRVPGRAQCLLDDALIARARRMGENIMKAVATPPEARGWLGDEDMGWCPNYHSNALVLGEPQWDGIHYPIECQVCGCGKTEGRERKAGKIQGQAVPRPGLKPEVVSTGQIERKNRNSIKGAV